MKSKNSTIRLKHKIAFFLVYLTLFTAISALIDYYAYDFLNPWILVVLTFVATIWATIVHLKSNQQSKVDELAHDVEKIL